MHLNFIVDQTEKYSSWLTAGLKAEGSTTSSLVGSDGEHSVDSGDGKFLEIHDFESTFIALGRRAKVQTAAG